MGYREVDNLLKYLEEHGKTGHVTQPKKIEEKVEPKIEPVIEQVADQTRRIIEECETEEIVYPELTSKGFDVTKFKSLERIKLIEDYKRNQSYERPYISVRDICSCIRKVFYERLKYPVDLKKLFQWPNLALLNVVGNSVDEFVKETYDFTEINKVIISEKYKVKGKCDGIKDKYLIELKTTDFDKFKGNYNTFDYYQGLIYAYILNNEYGYSLEWITLVYFIRTFKKDPIPFDLTIDNKLAEKLLTRGPLLHESMLKKIAPDPYGATTEECNFCPYIQYCRADSIIELVQPFKLKEEKKEEKKKSTFLL